jgi:hypothetical protein
MKENSRDFRVSMGTSWDFTGERREVEGTSLTQNFQTIRSVQTKGATGPRYELKPDDVKYHPGWVPCYFQSRVPGVVKRMEREKERSEEMGWGKWEAKGGQGIRSR